MNKSISITILLLILTLPTILLINLSSCDTTEPPEQTELPKAIKLKLLEISCTEAFINVNAADSVLPVAITLKKDNTVLFSFTLTKTDTVVIDTTLQPNITYTYQTTAQIKGKEENSDTIQVKTLNTTSHNFTWQTFTFGGIGGSSVLNDVAIIDENNVWAVGEIYADTTGQAYNAVHWNGSSWELLKLQFYTFCGQTSTGSYPAKAIFAFDNGEIWISSSGDKIALLENGIQIDKFCLPSNVSMSINKIWGSSSDDLYAVGNGGNIAHYKNGSWSRIESGTTTNINDVWGINDSTANNSLALCTVSSRYHLGDYKLLSISGNTANEYFNWPYTRLYGIWFNSPRNIYIVGAGAYVYKNSRLKTINLPTNYFLTRVKGNALNDVYISTSDALIFHYDGIDWNEFSNGIYGGYEGMDIKSNTVALVGYNIEGGIVGKAIVTIGKHIIR